MNTTNTEIYIFVIILNRLSHSYILVNYINTKYAYTLKSNNAVNIKLSFLNKESESNAIKTATIILFKDEHIK